MARPRPGRETTRQRFWTFRKPRGLFRISPNRVQSCSRVSSLLPRPNPLELLLPPSRLLLPPSTPSPFLPSLPWLLSTSLLLESHPPLLHPSSQLPPTLITSQPPPPPPATPSSQQPHLTLSPNLPFEQLGSPSLETPPSPPSLHLQLVACSSTTTASEDRPPTDSVRRGRLTSRRLSRSEREERRRLSDGRTRLEKVR